MTTWTYPSKARIETELAREQDDNILLESGSFLLVEEDYIPFWYENSKNSSTWSELTKNITNWSYPATS